MNNLLSMLPRELQDHISTYNVDHRGMMSHVFRELIFWYQDIECENYCGVCVRRNDSICKNTYYSDDYYCSEHCAWDSMYSRGRSFTRIRVSERSSQP